MSTSRYPVFEPGQTLTAEDLNDLRAFLDGQDRTTGRLIGFGVACGLAGHLDGTELTIDAGLAIDQNGEALALDEPFVGSITAAADGTVFDFIEGASGRSAVLRVTETEEPAPACGEEDCEGHAAVVRREVSVVLVAGRLEPAGSAFANETLLDAEPVRMTASGGVAGAFVGLKEAILKRWAKPDITLSDAAVKLLTNLAIEPSDLEGVKALKAGFLNQVLFATLDLLRCRALHGTACFREADPAGVVLGWVDTSGTTPVWDCEYRHHFAPPPGLSMALLGGTCDDPCELYRQRLEALVENFRVPETPAPTDPPSGEKPGKPDFHWCPEWRVKQAKGSVIDALRYHDCLVVEVPPKRRVFDDWRDRYRLHPEDRFINKQDLWTDPPPGDPTHLYGEAPLDFTDAGILDLTLALGKNANDVAVVLEGIVEDHGMTPDVRVLTKDQANALDGFAYKAGVSLGDTVVVVRDDRGKAVATGRVANATTLRGANAGIDAARTVSSAAQEMAAGAVETVGDFDARLTTSETAVADFKTFQEQTVAWQQQVDPIVKGLDTTIDQAVAAAVPEVERRITQRIDGRIDDLYRLQAGGPVTRGFEGPGVNRTIVDFLGGMRDTLETVSAGRRGAPEVREALREADDALAVLTVRAGETSPLAEAAPTELATVVESLVAGVRAAGVRGRELERLESDASALLDRIR